MAQLALVYDPRGHTFESWSALMCEAYAAQQLQIDSTEEHWKDWAAGLKAIDVFVNEGIPESNYIRMVNGRKNSHFVESIFLFFFRETQQFDFFESIDIVVVVSTDFEDT